MSKKKFLVLDLGNTDIKFGVFQTDYEIFGRGWDELDEFIGRHGFDYALVSNVALKEHEELLKNRIPKLQFLHEIKNIPVLNLYKTPHTLGQDRLCNAVAIHNSSNGNAALSIDVGTCLKFDFVNAQGEYLGGSISPGLQMRFKALHEFTANLPQISSWDGTRLIGTDTHSSITSGVVEGMANEINETIRRYESEYENLTIFLTGGDLKHFENAIKYRIFADPNLTLRGLKIILEANV